MIDIDQLRRLWIVPTTPDGRPIRRRTTKLLVDAIVSDGHTRALHAPDWAFVLPFASAQAIDIELTPRTKHGVTTEIWTQGPSLAFSEGDIFHARNGRMIVQVEQADPMRWTHGEDGQYRIDEGFVTFRIYRGATASDLRALTQTAFLRLLMAGI